MELWEYQVIHLNIEGPGAPPAGPAPAPPAQPPPAPAAAKPETVFSKEYLEKEFPGFYGPAPPPAQDHPALQLRGFLNQQGREGWQLVGFFPVGKLMMMIFRRPLQTEQGLQSGVSAQESAPAQERSGRPEPPTASPDAAPSPPTSTATQATAAAETTDPQPAVLERLLTRLEALERRLSAAGDGEGAMAELDDATAALARLSDGSILPENARRDLAGRPHLSTAEAALALGFRSTASLFNRAARSGYQPGLVKRGANGRLAIYMGSERSDHGGRDRRLWVVLEPGAD
jgi:hypothetical protein